MRTSIRAAIECAPCREGNINSRRRALRKGYEANPEDFYADILPALAHAKGCILHLPFGRDEKTVGVPPYPITDSAMDLGFGWAARVMAQCAKVHHASGELIVYNGKLDLGFTGSSGVETYLGQFKDLARIAPEISIAIDASNDREMPLDFRMVLWAIHKLARQHGIGRVIHEANPTRYDAAGTDWMIWEGVYQLRFSGKNETHFAEEVTRVLTRSTDLIDHENSLPKFVRSCFDQGHVPAVCPFIMEARGYEGADRFIELEAAALELEEEGHEG